MNSTTFVNRLSITSLFVLVSACASVPVDERPDNPVKTPVGWHADTVAAQAQTSWLASFDDAELTALVNEALNETGGNLSLRSTVARVRAAQAQQGIVDANRWPQLALALGGARSKQNIGGTEVKGNDFSLQAQLNWELDLWGRLSNQSRAAFFDYRASESDLAAARLSLTANIARGWYNAVAAVRQQQLAEHTAESFSQSLAVIEERYRSGIGDALDVSFARANAASAQSQLEARRIQADNSVLTLETLLGRYPQRQLAINDELPAIPGSPAVGVPLQMLERRPDLRAAHDRLLAASSRNVATQRNFLPSLNLTGSDGVSTSEFRDLFDLEDLVWRIAAQLTAPIFQGGRLKAQRTQAEAVKDQAVWDYAAVALQAFQEVESALRAEKYLAGQEQAVATATRESNLAEELAGERYATGLVDITTLLESQRRAFDARRTLIDVRNQRLQNRINLHLALGGDNRPGSDPNNKDS